MDTLETLKRRIRTAEELHSLVRTMKAMAAVNIRHLERAVESLADYRRTVEMGLQVVLRQRDRSAVTARIAPQRTLGAIVFGSDQGMCGQLNDQMAAFAAREVEREAVPPQARLLLAVGIRVAARLEDAGHRLDTTLPVAASTVGITPLVGQLLVHLDRWHTQRHVDRVLVFYSEHISRAAYEPRRLDLLPIDRRWLDRLQQQPWPTRTLPTFNMDPDRLFSSLVRQYLFVSLYRACAESQASENAARLAAMRGAERNISERITELTHAFHQTRQMTITEELLDIASGFEALLQEH